MSSTFIKALKCFFCSKFYTIEDINFPNDVFELIRQYKLDENLFWTCDKCKSSSKEVSMQNFAISPIKSSVVYKEIGVYTPHKDSVQQHSDVVDDATESEFVLVEPTSLPHASLRSCSAPHLSLSPPDNERSALKYMQTILNAIKISHVDKAKNKQILREVIEDTLLNNMKENDEFKAMINRPYYTGSAYNELKITSANEYDINLVFKVPKSVTLSPEFFDENCAFLKLKWESTFGSLANSSKFFSENSDKNYLNPEKVLSWLQRHIDLSLQKNLEWSEDVSNVVNSASGPARTIVISTNSGYNISVDLVPVFEFDYTHLSSTAFYDKVNKIAVDKSEHNCFFAVPKLCTDGTNISVSDAKLCWRLDFPNAEKYILLEKECAKSVIKILKIIRDKKGWKGLASYYLKMVVILEILKNPSKEYWKNANLYIRLLDSLEQLTKYLFDGCIPHFLTQHNLIQKLNETQRSSWSNHLKNVIKTWKSDPANIVAFLEADN